MTLGWAKDIPSNWTICESQFILQYHNRPVNAKDEIVTAFRDGRVTLRKNRRQDGFTNAEKEIGYQHIKSGDLVVHSMDGGFGAVGISDSEGKASPVVHAYTSEVCNLRFINYQINAAIHAGWIAALGKGIRVRSTQFDRQTFAGMKMAFPSLEEQNKIADYLDHETAEIDAAVADLDKYISLLNVRFFRKLEDTFETLSNTAPQIQTKFLCNITTGNGDTQDAVSNGEYPFYVRSDNIERSNEFEFDCDAVLTSGDGAGVGKIFHRANGRFQAHQRVYVMSRFQHVSRDYFYWAFRSLFPTAIRYGGAKSTVDSVRRPMIANLRIPVPSETTQDTVIQRLTDADTKIDSLIADATKLRDLLLKRRSVLITEVVTGRKKV